MLIETRWIHLENSLPLLTSGLQEIGFTFPVF